ncbi:MAG: putative bifunctional family b-glycosyltransferase/PBP transpeptidase [Rickettsiales bacterium]|jgi:penicillin-binding protein 1A|nr:putative bifunctional family b-glycosyltransferase/PBP transpeptidase [Rickettsiales bacterium]
MLGSIRKILFFLGTIFALSILFGSVAVLAVIYKFSSDLPDYRTLAEYNPPTTTRLYAGDGRLLEEYAKEKRLFVPFQAIPKRVINAFLAAEDQNFYNHPGIDITSIARAAVHNLANAGSGKGLIGGSTITQQVVKNFLLSNERSYERKVKEAILAFRITQAYSKDRILELYLNEIYLGLGSYGVAAAALNYFDKSIDDLSIEEAALLAGMPKAPSNYDPNRVYDRALKRRNYVLERMYEDGYITEDEYDIAIEKPILLKERGGTDVVRADDFAEAVRRELVAKFGEKKLYEDGFAVRTTIDPKLQEIGAAALRDGLEAYDVRHGWRGPVAKIKLGSVGAIGAVDMANKEKWPQWLENLRAVKVPEGMREGWSLATVIKVEDARVLIGTSHGKAGEIPSKEMQWARTKLEVGDVVLVKKIESEGGKPSNAAWGKYALKQIPQLNGALVAMDPHTGRVLAMVGGYSGGVASFNRATQGKRQPGSSFKPFVYLAALEQGFTPASIVIDAEIEFSQGAGKPDWKPKNYSGEYYGPSTLRIGVERSRNAMTVRLAQMMGLNHVLDIAKRFGFGDNLDPNYSLVLGSAEVTPLALANAYAIVVNGGQRVSPHLIERIQDRNGKTIFRQDERVCEGCQLTHSTPAEGSDEAVLTVDASPNPPEIPDVREQVTDPQSAYQIVSIMEGVVRRGTAMKAASLGRTLGGKTGTTNNSNDTWFAGFSPDLVVIVYAGFDTPRTLGKHETGASVALPIFIQFMQAALDGKPDVPFRIPQGIELVRVDRETGLLPSPTTPAKNILLEAFKTGTAPSSSHAPQIIEGEEGEAPIDPGVGGVY